MLVADLLLSLLSIPSVSGSEADLARWIEDWCTSLGWPFVREDVQPNRWNLLVLPDSPSPVLFSTHLDTVPSLLPITRSDTTITGRGACDAKGALAAMLIAATQLAEQQCPPSLLFVVGEETDSIGAKSVNCLTSRKRWIVNGEPTENMLATGHKGVLSYRLGTSGIPAHSGYPDRGSSAVHRMLALLQRIEKDASTRSGPLGSETVNIGRIEGGTALNVLAAHCECSVMHRIVTSAEEVELRLRTLVGQEARLSIISRTDPQPCVVLSDFPSAPMAYGTDIPYLRRFGEPLLYGPGSIHDAHTEHECVSLHSLDQAVQDYVTLALALSHQELP